MTCVLFTDGSSSTKTKLCGWAVVGHLACKSCTDSSPDCPSCRGYGAVPVKQCGYGPGTNQTAELFALIYAIQISPPHLETEIISDSEYAIRCMSTYRKEWERRGFMTVDGKPIKYRQLIEYGHSLMDKKKIKFRHVRGHTGVEGNEEADKLCRDARYVAEGRIDKSELGDMLVMEIK